MTDIALATTNNIIDLQTDGYNGIAYAADEIQTAVIISLFTNGKSPKYNNTGQGAGWWGDSYSTYPIGSQLYTLFNSTITSDSELVQTATAYCNQALQWLITSKTIQSFSVACSMLSKSVLGISVAVIELKSSNPVNYSFAFPLS